MDKVIKTFLRKKRMFFHASNKNYNHWVKFEKKGLQVRNHIEKFMKMNSGVAIQHLSPLPPNY